MQRILNYWRSLTSLQRRTLVFVLGSLIVGYVLSSSMPRIASQEQWRLLLSKTPSFSITMPTAPRHEVVDSSRGIFASSDREGRLYTLTIGEVAGETPIQSTVQTELKTLFASADAYALDVTPSDIGASFYARRYDGGLSVRGTILVNGPFVYILTVAASEDPDFESAYQRYITSFQQ